MDFEIKEGLFEDIPSEVYHSIAGTFSSSQLKDLIGDNPELFHAKYIAKTIPRKEMAAFDIGTYFHTAVLEPEKLLNECVVYTGKRLGNAWETFKATHAGKAIITQSELVQAQGLIKAVQDSPIAMGRLKRGKPEVSAFLLVRVYAGEVYAVTWKKRLGKYGWEDAIVPKKGVDIWLKVRADSLGESFIIDLKSTTGNATVAHTMKGKVSALNYDLSAALYLDVFSAARQKLMTEFLWIFASKDFFNAKTWLASTKNILIGRAKWKKAVIALAHGIESEWVVEDSIGILEPSSYENEWIEEKAENIL